MEEYSKITKQIGFSYITMFLIFILSFVLIFILTRNLSIKEYGVYTILAATVAIFSVVLELGLTHYIITKLSGIRTDKRINSFFSILLFEFVFLSVIMLLLFTPLQNQILSFFKLSGYKTEFQIALILLFLSSIFRSCSAYFIANRRLELNNFLFFLNQGLWIILLILFFLTRKINLTWVMILWLSGVIISLLAALFYMKTDILLFKIKNIDFRAFKKGLIFGLPLIPSFAGEYIVIVSDRYVLNYYSGAAAVGIYSLAYTLIMFIFSLGAIITQIFYPYIAKAWNTKKDYNLLFNTSLKCSLMIATPALAGMFFLRDQIITLVSGPAYLQANTVIPILISFPLFAVFIQIAFQNLLLRNRTKLAGIIYITGGSLNLILNFALIPKYSLYGAAIATIISYIIMFIMMLLACRGYLVLNYEYIMFERIVIAALIMGVTVSILNPQVFLTKFLTIIFGVVLYISLLFVLRVFTKQEIAIIRKFFKPIWIPLR